MSAIAPRASINPTVIQKSEKWNKFVQKEWKSNGIQRANIRHANIRKEGLIMRGLGTNYIHLGVRNWFFTELFLNSSRVRIFALLFGLLAQLVRALR